MFRAMYLTLGALFMTVALSSAAVPAHAAQPTLTKLENGLSVLVQPDDRFPLVALRLYVRAGAAYETSEQAGISHLLEHMVFKGTGRRAPGEVAETIEGAGGYLNAATSFDYTVYTIDLPSERWELGLDVLQDMIFNTKLDPEELEREKKVVLAELERGEDNPSSRRFKAMQPLIWGGSNYERPIIGYRETVESFTRQDILDYIDEFYQPQSMLAVVVGDVNPDEALGKVRQYFGDLENHGDVVPKTPLPVMNHGTPRIHVEKGPWNKAYVAVGFPLPSLHTAEVPGLDMLGHLLGGDDTSRLYRKFKYELGLVDDISAYSLTLEQVGMFYIGATLDGDKLPEFWEALNKELATLDTSSFTDRELERARLNIEDSLYSSKETIGGLASKLGYFQFFENSLEAEGNYLYALSEVGRVEMQDLADRYLAKGALAVSALVPENGDGVDDLEKTMAAAVDKAWNGKIAKAEAEAAAAGTRGDAETVDLGGGRTLVLLPDGTLPYTSVTMAFTGGDSLLFPDEQGLAALAAKALTRGAGGLNATEYEDYLSDRAAAVSASASRDLFVVAAKFPSRFSGDVLGVMRDTLNNPAFATDEIDRAKAELIAAIHRREDQPTGRAFRHLFPMLFADTGYSYLHMGTEDDVATYGVDEVRTYWERQLKQPWVMAVSGDFDRESVSKLARELARGDAEPFTFAAPTWNDEFSKNMQMPDRNQSHIVVAFPVPGSRHKDSVGLDLLRQALAGQGGKLFLELRDKQGLGYTVTAFLWQAPETGFLAFYIGTYPDKTEQALEGFRKAVADLHAEPLADKAVDRAKNLVRGDYYRDHQSLSSRSREAAGLMVRGYDLDHNRKDIDAAQQLTAEDLKALAIKYLIWDDAYTLTVTP